MKNPPEGRQSSALCKPDKPPPSKEGKLIELDVRGLCCPMPILKTREIFGSLSIGEVLRVIADQPAAEADLHNWVRFTGQEEIGVSRVGTKICFSIRKRREI